MYKFHLRKIFRLLVSIILAGTFIDIIPTGAFAIGVATVVHRRLFIFSDGDLFLLVIAGMIVAGLGIGIANSLFGRAPLKKYCRNIFLILLGFVLIVVPALCMATGYRPTVEYRYDPIERALDGAIELVLEKPIDGHISVIHLMTWSKHATDNAPFIFLLSYLIGGFLIGAAIEYSSGNIKASCENKFHPELYLFACGVFIIFIPTIYVVFYM